MNAAAVSQLCLTDAAAAADALVAAAWLL